MKFDKWTQWIALLVSVSLLILPTVIPICEIGAKPMRCFYAFQAEFLFELLAVVTAVSLFFVKERETKSVSGFFLFIIGIIIFIIPSAWVIGICGHSDSACHLTAVSTRGLSVVLALAGAFIAWRNHTLEDEDSKV